MTERLSISEKVTIVRLYTACGRNSLETVRRFTKPFPGRFVTSKTTININRFDETGSVQDLPRSGRARTARSQENTAIVQTAIEESPTTSTRRLTAEMGISQRSEASNFARRPENQAHHSNSLSGVK